MNLLIQRQNSKKLRSILNNTESYAYFYDSINYNDDRYHAQK